MSRKRILVVDDEVDIVNLVRLILEDAGYEVQASVSGVEALDKLRNEQFDLVLLDVMMPTFTGWDVLRELRRQSKTKEVPVALLTARASPRDDNRQHPSEFCDYIPKPFGAEDLVSRIEEILGRQRGNPGTGNAEPGAKAQRRKRRR